jgi:hypothetical protein
MSNPKWMNGPWHYREMNGWRDERVFSIMDEKESMEIAIVAPALQLTEANARLLAVAPKLYDVLKAITDCYGVGSTPEKFCEHVKEFMLAGRDVLAEARGDPV